MNFRNKIILCAMIVICGCNSGYHEEEQQSQTTDTSSEVNKRVPVPSTDTTATVQSNQSMVVGEWKFTDNESMGDDNQSTIVVNGTASFNSDNVYNYSADIVANIYNAETQLSVPLSYKYEETGKWAITNNNILSQTVITNRLTANNETAQEFENDNPNKGVHNVIPLEGTESSFRSEFISQIL